MVKRKQIKDSYADREAKKYEKPIPSREYILALLEEQGKPLAYKHLVAALELDDPDDQEALRRRLLAMVRDGQLLQNRRGVFGLVDKMELIAGYVIGHKDGFGFVVPEEGGDDLYLNPREMRAVFHNDRVLVRVSRIDNRGRREASIIEVIERKTKQLVGRLFSESGAYFVETSNQRITQQIIIPADQLANAQHGQMVVIEIMGQPTIRMNPIGRVVDVLGDHMAPGMEIEVAIRNHGLPFEWPDAVLAEAQAFAATIPSDAIKGRLDVRHLPFVTIDGEDAKDFDDAVYAEPLKKGGWILRVAIADVSHYVRPGTELDKEAEERGNSVYFPDRVIPMLPEVLSNGLCSLNPKVDRLTLVCEMTITQDGKVTHHTFHEAVINSNARLTYNQVYAMVAENDSELRAQYKVLLPHLQELFAVYAVLQKARRARGAIDFDMPETKIVFGVGRKIEKIIPLIRNDAHKVIEECMLAANISTAHFLLKNDCPTLFRIHEGPTPEKLEDLRGFLGEQGLKFPSRTNPVPGDYAALLKTLAGRPDAHLIQTVLLRSLRQAIYSPENKGHFGLAFDAYTHFTSPIRRYPDLLVHRAIRSVLQREKKSTTAMSQLEKDGEHCSMTERRADDATREAIDWLKCEYMLDKVGSVFMGVISSVTSFGLFIELKDIYIEGLAHISYLPSDYYHFDAINHSLNGERSGKSFRLGDEVEIRVAKVDLDLRQIDFSLVAAENEKDQKAPEKKAAKGKSKQAKRKSSKRDKVKKEKRKKNK